MQFLIWLRDRLRGEPSRAWERHLPPAEAKGDFRGSYGFGRRAHRPDPSATYSFGDDPTHRMTDPHH